MPTLNRPLVERIIEKLETSPEQHDQEIFGIADQHCGTRCCVAGWAAVLSPDAKADWDSGDEGFFLEFAVVPGHGRLYIDHAAQVLMGISTEQASSLFYDFGDTEHMVRRLRALLAKDATVAV